MPNNQELSPVITEDKLLQFYNTYVKPYINAESGGHEIKNEGDTDPLTQRETMILQAPLFAEDDSTNETTNLNVDVDADLSGFPVPVTSKTEWEHNYSTSEQVAGKWIDGRNVYEKTYTLKTPNVLDTPTNIISIGAITTIDNVWIQSGFVFANNNDNINMILDVNTDVINNGIVLRTWFGSEDTNRTIRQAIHAATFLNTDFVITIRYTKTTDIQNA